VAWSLAADFRRARIYLLRTVFRLQKAGLPCQERSPVSSLTFVLNDGGTISQRNKNPSLFSTRPTWLSTAARNFLPYKQNPGV
jgi:hypothetical protein